jgi:ureidoglycolate lyase
VSDARAHLRIEPLDADAFAPFGEVIEPAGAKQVYAINDGTAQRFHDLAALDCDSAGGRVILSLFRAQPRPLPFEVAMLERHPLGTQAFVPLDPATRYLVVVSQAPEATPRAFLAAGGRGINLHRGTWHHPLLALERVSDFLVIDRGGPGANCDEVSLPLVWTLAL